MCHTKVSKIGNMFNTLIFRKNSQVPGVRLLKFLITVNLCKMKRLILTADLFPRDGESESGNRYSTSLNQIYAHIHNTAYEFVQYKNALIEDRHYNWARIPLLQKYAKEYDEIVWLDPSVIIVDRNTDIFEYLKTAPESKWIRDKTASPILYTVVDKPTNDAHACSHIFLLDCRDKEAVKNFLNNWWNDLIDNKFFKTAPYQQYVWNYLWTKDPVKRSLIRVADITTLCEEKGQVFLNVLPQYGAVQINILKKYYFKVLNIKNPCSKRIGIFMRFQNLYTNGAGQNCIFLKHAIESTGHCVDLIVTKVPAGASSFVAPEVKYEYLEFSKLNLGDYCLIIFASGIPQNHDIDKIKSAGVRHIIYTPANIFDAFHVDTFLNKGKEKASLPLLESEFHALADECWIPETHKHPTLEYLRTLNRNKIEIKTIPHLWSPLFTLINGELPIYKQRSSRKIDIVIIEPNMSYVKCGLAPLMISEKLNLEKPELINKVYFYNSPDNDVAKGMIKSLKLSEDGKIKFMPRMPINEILKFFAEPGKNNGNHVVFLAHQTYVPHNYAYYDVLASGFPLVHNSPPLFENGVGLYYTDFENGAQMVESVLSLDISSYREKALKYLETYNPYNEAVVKIVKERLVCDKKRPLHYPDLSSPLCISYDNEPTETTLNLLKTLRHNKWDTLMVGKGEIWGGYITKFKSYKKVLEDLPAEKVIILSDSRDVFCLRGAWSFIKAFKSFNAPIVVSMEIFAEGRDYWREGFKYEKAVNLKPFFDHHGLPTPVRQFVNSGLIAGYAGAIKEMVDWVLENGFVDDQLGVGNFMLNFPDKVGIDPDATLLHTSTFGINAGVQIIKKQSIDSPNFAELMGNGAWFLHIPGIHQKGQKLVYNQVKQLLDSGMNNREMLKLYSYDEPSFDEEFMYADSAPPSIAKPTLTISEITTPKSIHSRIQTIIINGNPMRKQFLEKMFSELKIKLDFDFFEAFIPENSKEYTNFKTERLPELDTLLCCSRSHGAAIHSFVNNPKYKDKEIVLVLEDDVTFIKEGFEEELTKIIELWEKHEDEVDYVNIGYLTMNSVALKSDKNLHWDTTASGGALWGAQAYLIKRSKAIEMASVIHKETSKDLYESILEMILTKNNGFKHCNKQIQLTPDSYLSILWRQGFCRPPLAVEFQSLDSTITGITNSSREIPNRHILSEMLHKFYSP
jgi:GR25 family glycosyltransferase involved in LPS biosynthesis